MCPYPTSPQDRAEDTPAITGHEACISFFNLNEKVTKKAFRAHFTDEDTASEARALIAGSGTTTDPVDLGLRLCCACPLGREMGFPVNRAGGRGRVQGQARAAPESRTAFSPLCFSFLFCLPFRSRSITMHKPIQLSGGSRNLSLTLCCQ